MAGEVYIGKQLLACFLSGVENSGTDGGAFRVHHHQGVNGFSCKGGLFLFAQSLAKFTSKYDMLKPEKTQEETMLRQIRYDVLDMKQDEFSVWLGVTQGTVSRCENGKTEMTLTSRQWHRLFSRVENKLGIAILQKEPIDLSSRQPIEQWLKKK